VSRRHQLRPLYPGKSPVLSVQEAGLASGPIPKARQISGFNSLSFQPVVSRYTDYAIGRLIKNAKFYVFSHSNKDFYQPHTRYSNALREILSNFLTDRQSHIVREYYCKKRALKHDKPRTWSENFYCFTVHFDDSNTYTHQLMHLYHILLNH
jgi:hypothetical protein